MAHPPTHCSPQTSECPSLDVLRDYFLGLTDEFISASVDSHLGDCETCNTRLARLETTDGAFLQAALQGSAANGLEAEPEDAQLAVDAAWRAAQRTLQNEQLPIAVGQYQILERIGRGGMGSVYRAEHAKLKKVVALKLIPIQWSDAQTLQRFDREVQAAGQLQHPGIVTATDAGTESGMQYLAMEFVDGLDLGKLMRCVSPIPTADACEILRQVALALAHAHQLGIIHRDIKPSNIMLDANGKVKLLDFGLVHFHRWDGSAGDLTTVGQFLGTLDYMAPEQAERSEAVDARSDLYSLAATLFKLLTGQTPLAMTPHQSPIEKLKRLSQHQPILLQTLRPDLPLELCQTLNQLLSTRPDMRLPSALHVAQALLPFCETADLPALAQQGMRAAPEAIDQRNTHGNSVQPQAALHDAPSRRLPPSWGWWIALASVPLLAFFGFRILLESDQGNLVIESASDSLKIDVKRRQGGNSRELVVEQGTQLTRLQAGEYDITLHEASDTIAIEPDRVQLRRGETVIARVVRQPKSEAIPATQAVGQNAPNTPWMFNGVAVPESLRQVLFKGKTLTDWLRTLELERNKDAWREAYEAIQEADPDVLQQLADPIRRTGQQRGYFQAESNGWFLRVLTHDDFDALLMQRIEGQPFDVAQSLIQSLLSIPKQRRMLDDQPLQLAHLKRFWNHIEQQLASELPPAILLKQLTFGPFNQTPPGERLAELRDPTFRHAYPWIDHVSTMQPSGYGLSENYWESLATLLFSESQVDLDRFLFLSRSVVQAVGNPSSPASSALEQCRTMVRHRLAAELQRWADSGAVLGDLGKGPMMLVPPYNGICFGKVNTGGMGGGMGGMGGGMGGWAQVSDPPLLIDRGLALLTLCSGFDRDHRPSKPLENLAQMLSRFAESPTDAANPAEATETAEATDTVYWGHVYSMDSRGLATIDNQGQTRFLTEKEIAVGLSRWLSQLRLGDMRTSLEVAEQFWFALQQHTKGTDPTEWLVERGRAKGDFWEVCGPLPLPLELIELSITYVDVGNNRSVLHGELKGPRVLGNSSVVKIVLELEPSGWRIASMHYNDDVVVNY